MAGAVLLNRYPFALIGVAPPGLVQHLRHSQSSLGRGAAPLHGEAGER